jgi:hypothetical protein
MDLVRKLRERCLPISVFATEDESGASTSTAARLHTGPLLLSSSQEEAEAWAAEAEAADDHENATARRQRCADKALVRQPCKVAASWVETIGLAGLHSLKIEISSDMPVLSPPMLDVLLPASFTVDMVRGLPKNSEALAKQFADVYVTIYPDTNSSTESLTATCEKACSSCRPHNQNIRFAEPVVWLLGLAPPHAVREWLTHRGLTVEVHDQDSRIKPPDDMPESDPEEGEDESGEKKKRMPVVYPHGIAHFALTPLLESRSLDMPLRADVFPKRGNKKARRIAKIADTLPAEGLLSEKGAKELIKRTAEGVWENTTDYHKLGTVCTVRATLAVQIPAAAHHQKKDEAVDHQIWAAREKKEDDEGDIWVSPNDGADKAGAAPYRAKVQPVAGGEAIQGPWRRHREDAQLDSNNLRESLKRPRDLPLEGAEEAAEEENIEAAQGHAAELAKQPLKGIHRRFEKYGRVLILVSDNNTTTIQRILKVVRTRNCATLNIDSTTSELEMYNLSAAECADEHLDILTGFTVLDGKFRLMVVEGLREGGIKELMEQGVPRNDAPNSANFKVLFNPNVGFSERLYLGFEVPKLKTVKIRPKLSPLETLASQSNLYSFQADPGAEAKSGMCAPLLLLELKKMKRHTDLRPGQAFPSVDQITNLEILYGGYLTDEEIAGLPVGSGHGPVPRVRKTAVHARGSASAPDLKALLDQSGTMNFSDMDITASPDMANRGDGSAKVKATRKEGLNQGDDTWHESVQLRKTASMPNFSATNKAAVKERSVQNATVNDMFGKKRFRETPFHDGQEVFNYSSQKLASTEIQKEWMRAGLDPQQKDRSFTYAPQYMSQAFEFSGADPPGVPVFKSSQVNNSYARLPHDTRQCWREIHARDKEEYRQPAREIGLGRKEELHEQFMENEWHQLPIGVERRLPIAQHVRWEPNMVPHRRVISDRPFDASRINQKSKDCGPRSMFESVDYYGEGAPGEPRNATTLTRNVEQREKHDSKRIQPKNAKFFSQGATRECVTCTDRREPVLKDKSTALKHFRSDEHAGARHVPSIQQIEEHHDRGRPDQELQVRMRENDSSAPYNVQLGTYMPREHELGTKRACMSGTLGKAPWQHGSKGDVTNVPRGHQNGSKLAMTQAMQTVEYPSRHDFNTTRLPPNSLVAESHIWKNASRTSITKDCKKHVAYQRPADMGTRIRGH